MSVASDNSRLEDQVWVDDYAEPDEDEDGQIGEYDVSAVPNDFNVLTIYNFIESGVVRIPGFQRNYVWDIKRASRLIESLLLGLPVPQLFLYEEERNRFLVIDGQQRLMSLYYFINRRFPRKEKRPELRQIFDERGSIPEEILLDDSYFVPFKLSLPSSLPDRPNKFHGLYYQTLGEYKTQFELRPIRNVIVKQNVPKDDDSSIFEIFNRLNSGGVNLAPQEIRISLYHSPFYEMLYRINKLPGWRRILGMPDPDLHVKDIELLLRAFAMLLAGNLYSPSMTRFLNLFSKQRKSKAAAEDNSYLEALFGSFLEAAHPLPAGVFIGARTHRFNAALFEAVFTAALSDAFSGRRLASGTLHASQIGDLDSDGTFQAASKLGTTKTFNVTTRLSRAREVIDPL